MRRIATSVNFVAALESRQLLSGNVVLQFDGSNLRLTGDNSNNEIFVQQSLSGMIIIAHNGTKLSGVTNGSQTIVNPTSVIIDLKGGNDILNLGGFLGGQLDIQMGSGNDRIVADSIVCNGTLTVDLGSGNDRLDTYGTDASPNQLGGAFSLKGNSGNDRVRLGNALFNGVANVDMSNGNDAFSLIDCQLNGAMTVDLGTGNDGASIGGNRLNSIFNLIGNTGDDVVGMGDNSFVGNALFDLGEGKDGILSSNDTFDANVSRIGGKGTDLSYKINDLVTGTESVTGIELLPTTPTPEFQAFAKKFNAFFSAR